MCRNASPLPSDSSAKPKPFSGLNHFTVASIGAPSGGGGSKPRGRIGRDDGDSGMK